MPMSHDVDDQFGTHTVVGPYPGFRASFQFRLVRMRGAAAVNHEGKPRFHWPWTLWLNTLRSPAVELECVVLIFMADRRLKVNVQIRTCGGLLAPYRVAVVNRRKSGGYAGDLP
jgi:hypothetical protein